MTSNASPILLKDFVKKIMEATGMREDDLSFIDLINKRDYVKIRKNINTSIGVGDIDKFTGRVTNETELGDVVSVFSILLEKTFPNENLFTSCRALSLDEQRDFRDNLIAELDLMVAR